MKNDFEILTTQKEFHETLTLLIDRLAAVIDKNYCQIQNQIKSMNQRILALEKVVAKMKNNEHES